ncbi:hypothetical protein Y032_0069g385 [Ancylostoma ceylanicum]|uniref:Uncharacterized protein n=1 Tax=Ancylostoma ceylanicum TaxID=53326 RepID=A0A016TZI8_9BILA|nr:hypothetical protein Y032_0069g385 [Ancylostoma ceylanicum]
MAFVLAVLVLLSVGANPVTTSPVPNPQAPERKFFEVDTAKLQDFWHTAMVRGLIKAHSKRVLNLLPRAEQVVFGLCVRDAKSTVALAKCAVRVLDTRDAMEQAARERRTDPPLFRFFDNYQLDKPKFSTKSSVRRKVPEFKRSLYKDGERKRFVRVHKRKRRRKRTSGNGIEDTPSDNFLGKHSGNQRTAPKYEPMKPGTRPAMNFGRIISEYLRRLLLGSKPSSHIRNLQVIRDHFRRVEQCNQFFRRMNQKNRRFFDKVNLGIDSRTPEVENNAASTMEGVLEVVNDFAAQTSSGKLSVMSPRLFSLLPDTSGSSRNSFLSPTLLSFQKDGYLSLPELFDIVNANEKQQNMLLDIIMDVSGAGAQLEEMIAKIKPEIEEVRYIKLPLVQELSRKHEKWIRARSKFTDEQEMDYEQVGYAFMNKDQLELIYNRQEQLMHGINVTEIGMMTKEQKMKRIESDIRALAAMERPSWPAWGTSETNSSRHRRAAEGNTLENIAAREATESQFQLEEDHENRINGILFETLHPFAFTTEVGIGAALEVVTLSPNAFLEELLFPRALVLETLSPRAFLAAILSPNALIARVLSPTAFRFELLSPRALHTWIVSPEAFLAEILSPRFLDPRIASPQALLLEVLSPGILSPNIWSSETGSLLVLSPNILSPRIQSEEKMVVEVNL